MARVSGERAPAFTSEELEKLVDGVLPQYTLLYGPPDKQVSTLGACCMGYACVEWGGRKKGDGDCGVHETTVSAHQKKDIWRAIAKDVRTLGVYHRRSTHCRKRWEDIRH
ncbi:hypothetical protein NDU88_005309 [Pleurodeles waltl]|uniref:Myb/SANT-like DNA-binding domain-containing protein n=1 Tax=Pleurodeles waltl TaxID=8319 RepID=A0AAV7M9M1_PLEWA|nr:hypothetical protein NDU88_005309 [Pleurodeles waltl]